MIVISFIFIFYTFANKKAREKHTSPVENFCNKKTMISHGLLAEIGNFLDSAFLH